MFEVKIFHKILKNNQVTAMHIMVAIIFIILGTITSSIPQSVVNKYDIYIKIYGFILLALGIAISILTIFFNKKIIQSKFNSIIRYVEVFVLLSIIIYTLFYQWYLPFAYAFTSLLGVVFAILWEKHGKKDHTILVKEDGVHIPRFMRHQTIPWKNIQRLILRHGLITIDTRSNKLVQHLVLNKEELEGIEEYATQKILENEASYVKDWDE